MRILSAALSALTLSACVVDGGDAITVEEAHEDALSIGHAIARASLLASDDLLAASVAAFGEADGVWPWLTDDASYLHPGVPLLGGRGNIRDFLRATYPDRHAQTLRLHRETGDASTDATVGYTFGWFDEDVPTADGGRATKYGKYIATWTRSLGAWQVAGLVRVRGRARRQLRRPMRRCSRACTASRASRARARRARRRWRRTARSRS